jgi:hypothetical protein
MQANQALPTSNVMISRVELIFRYATSGTSQRTHEAECLILSWEPKAAHPFESHLNLDTTEIGI